MSVGRWCTGSGAKVGVIPDGKTRKEPSNTTKIRAKKKREKLRPSKSITRVVVATARGRCKKEREYDCRNLTWWWHFWFFSSNFSGVRV